MNDVNARTRLILCAVVVVGSVVYAILLASDLNLASAVALGYVAILLTILVAIEWGKKKYGR